MTTDNQTAIDMGYDDEGTIDEFERLQAMEDEEFAARMGLEASAELLELGDACDEFDYID